MYSQQSRVKICKAALKVWSKCILVRVVVNQSNHRIYSLLILEGINTRKK